MSYSGIYKSFEEISSLENAVNTYDQKIIADTVAEKTLCLKKESHEVLKLMESELPLLFLIGSLSQCGKLSVLDVGGACGSHYYRVGQIYNHLDIRWDILETPTMVKAASNYDFENKQLKFYDSLSSLKNSYSIVLFSGIIQYIDNWYSFIKEIVNSIATENLIFCRLPLSESVDFVTLQKSKLSEHGEASISMEMDADFVMAHHVFSRASFNKLIAKLGYRLKIDCKQPGRIDIQDGVFFSLFSHLYQRDEF
jgi:putative methyltransferase (TIGR04325 family)